MWDDGLESDLPLLDLLGGLGLTACFALSPLAHGAARTPNDRRDGRYGRRVSAAELRLFAPFEVCNHTATHPDLTGLGEAETRGEVRAGRAALEDLFGRPVDGFCYPYGCGNRFSEAVLRETGHVYARTTRPWPGRPDPLRLAPACRWDDPALPERLAAGGTVLFWGHTYEADGAAGWGRLAALYRGLAADPGVRVVTVKEAAARLHTVRYA